MLLDFTEELPPLTNEEVLQVFLNTLDLITGFSILFVQCSPAEANQLIPRVRRELPDRKIGVLELGEPIDNLYRLVEGRADRASLNILFIRGLEKSLEADIKPGYKGLGDYYNLNTVPPILSHLNQQRENFRDHFGNICFVFVLPKFAIRYFVRRAPDFYDWNSGVFEIADRKLEKSISIKDGFIIDNYSSHKTPPQTWNQKVLTTVSKLWSKYSKIIRFFFFFTGEDEFWYSHGNFLYKSGRYEEAIESYDRAITFMDNLHEIWYNRGVALDDLGRHKEAITSYDQAILFKANEYETWYNRGVSLYKLSCYEKAITSYDRAISCKADDYQAWYSRGSALYKLGYYEEVVISWRQAFNYISDPQLPRYQEDIAELIQEFIPRCTQTSIQQTLLIPLLTIYKGANVITELGAALVNTLHLIIAPTISDHTAAEWLSLWRTSSLGNEPAMELPLRLMTTAIEYKKDPSKRQRLWLNLPSEERPILDKALKLLD